MYYDSVLHLYFDSFTIVSISFLIIGININRDFNISQSKRKPKIEAERRQREQERESAMPIRCVSLMHTLLVWRVRMWIKYKAPLFGTPTEQQQQQKATAATTTTTTPKINLQIEP